MGKSINVEPPTCPRRAKSRQTTPPIYSRQLNCTPLDLAVTAAVRFFRLRLQRCRKDKYKSRERERERGPACVPHAETPNCLTPALQTPKEFQCPSRARSLGRSRGAEVQRESYTKREQHKSRRAALTCFTEFLVFSHYRFFVLFSADPRQTLSCQHRSGAFYFVQARTTRVTSPHPPLQPLLHSPSLPLLSSPCLPPRLRNREGGRNAAA